MNVNVLPFPASGAVAAQPSKSAAHRLMICAALADRPTDISFSAWNADMEATADCLTALGASMIRTDKGVRAVPVDTASGAKEVPELFCGESGSTLRFLLPVAAALRGARMTGAGRLPQRPLAEQTAQLRGHGVQVSSDHLPLTVSGGLTGGNFELPGSVSSQYFTGLMLAAPLAGETRIRILGALQSVDYIRMTRQAMALFGVRTELSDREIVVPGGQRYQSPGCVTAEGDWSGAAFPLALGALGGPVQVRGLHSDSAQGDRRFLGLLSQMGAEVTWSGDSVTAESRGPLRPLRVDVSDIPDLAPVLAALLMHAEGESALENAGRLRLKESDRLESTCRMVNALGGRAAISGDSLLIRGSAACMGGTVDGAGDHRIVMAGLVGASRCLGPSVLTDGEAVRKSYPTFFEDVITLGGQLHGIGDR